MAYCVIIISYCCLIASCKTNYPGNDTIDCYPLPYEGRLRKILCITKEVFKNLRANLAEFGLRPKKASSKAKTSFQQKSSQREPLAGSRNDNHKPERHKCIGSFEPSNIVYTNYRKGPVWTSRNLKAWFKEQESYEDPRYLKAYTIEI